MSRTEQEAVVERLLAAVRNGDMQALMGVLAPDVVVVSDGGGVVAAARRPIEGADRVGALLGSLAKQAGNFGAMPMWLNGAASARFSLEVGVEHGRDSGGRGRPDHQGQCHPQPRKLAHLDQQAELSR